MLEKKEYTNGEITVVWRPGTCIHSAICFNGLIDVFNPRRRPWIEMGGAPTESIIEQVKKCPSGALTYYVNGAEVPVEDAKTVETVIEVKSNGPLLIYGTIRVKEKNGNETVKSHTTAFCRCGNSKNKPYCDGSHVKAKFTDE